MGVSDESISFVFFWFCLFLVLFFSVLVSVLVLVWGSLMSQFSFFFLVLVFGLLGKQFADQMHCERIFSRRDALR